MGLNSGRAAAFLLVVVAAAATAQLAGANFADAAGFSGRAGATCVACHTPVPFPLNPPAAAAILEGLPEAWDPGATYRLTVRVEGGPPAMPAPQPQGGFDLDVSAGTLAVPAEFEGLLRTPHAQEATYLPAGTLMRTWQVDWTAPSLAVEPAPVTLWLAVLAANGNHVIATNASDGGERLDSSAALQAAVPPSDAARAGWVALPLQPPAANLTAAASVIQVEGRHTDGNATRLLWSLDGQPWQARDTALQWRLELPLEDGEHQLLLRSEGAGRSSPDTRLDFGRPALFDLPGDGRSTPLPLVVSLAALAVALLLRRSPA